MLSRPWTTACLLAHVLVGVAVALLAWPVMSPKARVGLERWFAQRLLRVLRVKLVTHFECPQANYAKHGPYLVYSNHVSWLDIFAFNAHAPVTFIAKSEIANWPLAGVLAKRSGTLFLERGKRHAVRQVIEQAVQVIGHGRTVAVFPEGTTGPGDQPLPFHSNFVQPALMAGVPLLPVSLQYRDAAGGFSAAPAYLGEQTLLENIAVLLDAPKGFEVHLTFHTPLQTDARTRHELSDLARERVAQSLKAGA